MNVSLKSMKSVTIFRSADRAKILFHRDVGFAAIARLLG